MADSKYTCRVKQVTQLTITRNGGTTTVTIDTFKGKDESRVNGGTIQISGDFGPWAHTWTHIGSGSFVDFLGELSFDYAMNKLVGSERLYEFDAEQTIAGVREQIIESRKENELEFEQAREYWDELESLDVDGERDFFECLNSISWYDGNGKYVCLTTALYGDDLCGVSVSTAPKGNTVYFWENLWPIILVELRKALEPQEAAA